MIRAAGAALAAALLALGASDDGADARTAASCATVILPEPAHTRGRSNTIRWERVPGSCWENDDSSGKKSTERRFVVTVTNTATGAKETVTVHGDGEVDATIDPAEFPGGAGAVDGRLFSYSIVRKERVCISGSPPLGICELHDTWTIPYSDVVSSTQDDRAPTGSLVLARGATFVRSLDVAATVTASDPGTAASGPGYVAFGGSDRRSGCGPLGGCAEPLGSNLTVRLAAGADGPRIVEGRVYDRARGPADDPGTTTIGTPPGNVSAPFRATVVLDRTAPYISTRVSTVRVTVGAPVTFDASQSADPNGSGVLPTSGEWTFGDGARATTLVATHTYTRLGRFPLAFSVADRVGNVAQSAPGEVEVVAAPVAPEPRTTETPPRAPAPTTVDRTAPTLTALTVRRRSGRTTIGFRLSERAVVRVEVRRLLPRPVKWTTSITRQLGAGRRGVVLLPAATRKTGRYAIVLVARDRAGNVSRVRTLTLTTR